LDELRVRLGRLRDICLMVRRTCAHNASVLVTNPVIHHSDYSPSCDNAITKTGNEGQQARTACHSGLNPRDRQPSHRD